MEKQEGGTTVDKDDPQSLSTPREKLLPVSSLSKEKMMYAYSSSVSQCSQSYLTKFITCYLVSCGILLPIKQQRFGGVELRSEFKNVDIC